LVVLTEIEEEDDLTGPGEDGEIEGSKRGNVERS
jgi:hypothetical protein